MRVSELEFTTEMRQNVWRGHSVETKTDSLRMVANERHAQQYIDQFGDVEIVLDEKYNTWKVPVFAEKQASYSDAKQRYCDQHGSEQMGSRVAIPE